MKSLQEYINESLVNERYKYYNDDERGFWGSIKKAWKWFIGSDDEEENQWDPFKYNEEENDKSISEQTKKDGTKYYKVNPKLCKLQIMPQDISVVKNYIEKSNPSKKDDTGFWLFDEALKKDSKSYGSINSEPWYIIYGVYTNDNNKAIGMLSWSTKYKKIPDHQNDVLHIFDIQTNPLYKGNNLLKNYIEELVDIGKKEGKKYLSLRPYEKSLEKKYEKLGFKKNDKDETAMILDIYQKPKK